MDAYIKIPVANIKTPNSRIYTKECLQKAINDFQDKIIKKQAYISATPDLCDSNFLLNNTVGIINKMELDDINIKIDYTPIKNPKFFDNIFEISDIYLTGNGLIENNYIKDYKILYAFLIPKEQCNGKH